MKTKIDIVTGVTKDEFKKDLQLALDAIELNVNNKVIDIKYEFSNGFSALIIYTDNTVNEDKVMLNE